MRQWGLPIRVVARGGAGSVSALINAGATVEQGTARSKNKVIRSRLQRRSSRAPPPTQCRRAGHRDDTPCVGRRMACTKSFEAKATEVGLPRGQTAISIAKLWMRNVVTGRPGRLVETAAADKRLSTASESVDAFRRPLKRPACLVANRGPQSRSGLSPFGSGGKSRRPEARPSKGRFRGGRTIP